ncbi:unnamed protein product [Arctia plantaginis]|uniref:F-box domain-containing protein n=1 Tax=Arctia plantaginis TaxID=874455 RepID=A0A8S1BB63_ARCPL|nr:unnamed protein product [Arctia plantaginis]
MDVLPDEVLDMVFKYLSTPMLLGVCVRVCRRWRYVVERQALALREEGDERRLHRAMRRVLVTTFPVDLLGLMDNIIAKVRFIREITVHCSAAFHEPHTEALRMLPNLVHLDVFLQPRVLDERLSDIIRRLNTLVANEKLAPGLLRDLAASSQLVALHMYGRAMLYPCREMLDMLSARAPYMRELTLRCNQLPDAAFSTIGDCYNLLSLQLYSCRLLSTMGARALCRPRRLRRLHVTGACLVRRHALADMLELLPENLNELVLSNSWFGDEHVRIVAKSARELRVVELWCCKLTAAGAKKLACALPKLEQLDLDLTMPKRFLQAMARHSSLRFVRCVPDKAGRHPEQYMQDHPIWEVDGLRIFATYALYNHKYFRTGDEGFRSVLFYYWMQDVPPEPHLPYEYSEVDTYEDPFY